MHHIHETIDDDPDRYMYKEETFQTKMRLKKFSHVFYTDIKELVATTPSKSCKLDPIPTALLKSNIGVPALVIADIVNISLGNGKVCQDLKEALLRPLVKGNLDYNLLPSFHPVSDLSYLSKLTEHVVAKQIIRYTKTTNQMEPYQSAYREHFSTETALLRVKSDILEAINKKEIMCLVMLDLSAAFDSLEHSLILTHLKYCFGITDTCLKWFEDYLTGRNQQVVVTDSDGVHAKSTKRALGQGIPQGSVLGPIIFNLFLSPLGEICHKHGISFIGYADDSQNYLSFRPIKDDITPQKSLYGLPRNLP